MNKFVKTTFSFLLILLMVFIFTGCKPTKKDDPKYDDSLYFLDKQYNYTETYSLEQVVNSLKAAEDYLKETKSYSYTQDINGVSEEEYNYSGVTKIDATGDTLKASIELSGNKQFAFYLNDNKAYYNYGEDKFYQEVSSDALDLVNSVQSVIGSFNLIDSSSLTQDNIVNAGVEEAKAVVLELKFENDNYATIIIFNNKLMKVIYQNNNLMTLTMKYDYNKVDVAFPNDLNTYQLSEDLQGPNK